MKNETLKEAYSLLENGIIIPDVRLAIGAFWETQWGKRKVIESGVRELDGAQSEPFGV